MVILLLCMFAGLWGFTFATLFAFFNNVDKQAHIDLVYKYAHSYIPQKLETFSTGSSHLIVLYGSPEYLNKLTISPYCGIMVLAGRAYRSGL